MAESEPAYGRILDLLLAFVDRPTWTAEELAARTGDTRSTTYRLIKSLRERDLIVRHGANEYALGSSILRLSNNVNAGNSLYEIALPVMRELARDSGESVLLTVVVGDKSLALEQITGPRPINLSFKPGTLRPLYAGASSKVLLAHLDEPEYSQALTSIYESDDAASLPERASLEADLAEIRAHGCAVTASEFEPGVKAVAAPILDSRGRLHGALSIAGPEYRLPESSDARNVELVIAAAREVAEQTGGVPRV